MAVRDLWWPSLQETSWFILLRPRLPFFRSLRNRISGTRAMIGRSDDSTRRTTFLTCVICFAFMLSACARSLTLLVVKQSCGHFDSFSLSVAATPRWLASGGGVPAGQRAAVPGADRLARQGRALLGRPPRSRSRRAWYEGRTTGRGLVEGKRGCLLSTPCR